MKYYQGGFKIERRCVLFTCGLLLLSSNAFAVKNYFGITPAEMKMLPKFCKVGFSGISTKEQVWMNHLCPGLNALNHAELVFGDDIKRNYALQRSRTHFTYTLGHTQKTNRYRWFAFLKRGRAHELSSNVSAALSDYHQALKIKPKNIKIHLALIDLFVKLGDVDKARDLVDNALKIKPNSKSLLRRKKIIN